MLARQLHVYRCTTFKVAPKGGGRWDESCCRQCNLAEKGLVAKVVLSSHLSACSGGKQGPPGHLQQGPRPKPLQHSLAPSLVPTPQLPYCRGVSQFSSTTS